MRVILQNTETKLYFIDAGKWTDDPSKATDFQEIDNAAHAYHAEDLSYARIVVDPHLGAQRSAGLTELFNQVQPPA